MRYIGGKFTIAKRLTTFLKLQRKPEQWYVEPFVGGANVIKYMENPRIASDVQPYLVSFWKALQSGYKPPKMIHKDEYYMIKENKELFPPELVGFVGFAGGFGGKWFGSYVAPKMSYDSKKVHKDGAKRKDRFTNAFLYTYNATLRQVAMLAGTEFHCLQYQDLFIPAGSIVYCDPPYEATISGWGTKNFEHESFWRWCRDLTHQRRSVFVSSYTAPDDFVEVWNTSRTCCLNNTTREPSVRTERLFIHESIKHKVKGIASELV